jgi:hypothetical protein
MAARAPPWTSQLTPALHCCSPRSCSLHQAALQGIEARQAALEQRLAVLKDRAAKDPSALDASDKQQLERLAATLACLGTKAGADVR